MSDDVHNSAVRLAGGALALAPNGQRGAPSLFDRPAFDRPAFDRVVPDGRARMSAASASPPGHHRGSRFPREGTVEGSRQRDRRMPPVPQAATDLLADASRGLGRAIRSTEAADRYAAAHLAALRAAAGVLAARARPTRGRRGSVWQLISAVAPELAEWAAFFAAGSAKRQAAEAGLNRSVTPREADDMVRQAAAFLDLVEEMLSSGSRAVTIPG